MELVRGKKREFLRFHGTADIIEVDVFLLFIRLFQNAEYAFLSRLLSGKGEDWVMGQKDIDCFKSDLREVIGFIQRAGDADEERKFTFENEDKFKAMDEEAFDVIVSVTGSDELEGMKDACREEGGKINMCEAIQGMIRQGREEGRQDKACKVAKNMYSRGFTAMETAGLIEENLETVREWYEEWDRQMQ